MFQQREAQGALEAVDDLLPQRGAAGRSETRPLPPQALGMRAGRLEDRQVQRRPGGIPARPQRLEPFMHVHHRRTERKGHATAAEQRREDGDLQAVGVVRRRNAQATIVAIQAEPALPLARGGQHVAMGEGNQLGQRGGARAAQDERRGVRFRQLIRCRPCRDRHRELQRRRAVFRRLGADQWQAVAFGGASPLLVAIAGNQQRIERKLLEELVQLGRAEARIERYGDRRTADGDDGDRGLRRFRQHHTDARIAAETGLAQLPACLLDHLLQAAVIQRCVARGEHGGLLRYAARQLGERRVQGGGLGADRVGVGRRESRPRLGHGGVEVVVHGCLSLARVRPGHGADCRPKTAPLKKVAAC